MVKTTALNHYDIAIVGGGMIGTAAALGLAKLGFSIALIEAKEPQSYCTQQNLDLRVSAINIGSERLLQELNAFDSIQTMRSIAYVALETWEIDGFNACFHANEINQSHLGHIVENRIVQLALWQRLTELENITTFCPTSVVKFERNQTGITLDLTNGKNIHCSLLIGADGANSKVRQWAKIGVTAWDYSQSAMLINIQTDEQYNITWQQFTPTGPKALLPLPNKHASLVWYDDATRIQSLTRLSKNQLADEIREHFPNRLTPKFNVLDSGSFTLTRRHAQQYVQDNILLLGDAAHTINPLAGQGVNLGFKDVSELINTLSKTTNNSCWYNLSILQKYQAARKRDNWLMMSAMDGFYFGFSNNLLPLKLARNIGLKFADNAGIIKRQVLKYASGLS